MPTAGSAPLDQRFVAPLRDAGARYRSWGRVDERPNLAPTLCRLPTPADHGTPSQVRLSAAGSPHGAKLYYLWASSTSDYLAIATAGQVPAGFAIVKESFAAVVHPPARPPDATGELAAPSPITWLDGDGGRLHVGPAAGLYVMAKVGAADLDGTDAGWVYGTISTDGAVTSAGRVEECMACHEDAEHDRLFGLRPATRGP